MIAKINRAVIRHYADNGQTRAYVEWTDVRGYQGRTEGDSFALWPRGYHLGALFARARREGVQIEMESW